MNSTRYLFPCRAACMVLIFLTVLLVDENPSQILFGGSVTSEAEARIGRPLTPVSYAGVARRTTRRVVRRTAVYVSTLPAGCAQVSINGAIYWQCGTTFYQQSGSQYVVVEVQ